MDENQARTLKRAFLVINSILLCIGTTGGPLVLRLYFIHGGERVWLTSWLESAGFPLIVVPLTISYRQRRAAEVPTAKLFSIKPFLFIASAFIGALIGLDNYLYACGIARLPVSTSNLIIATQLAFTAGFAFVLVKQKFNFYSMNSVFLLSVGAGVLALHSSSDRPKGESNKEYFLGFVMILGEAALYDFILPSVELTYKKAKQVITYSLVLEFQMVTSLFATGFCTVGMLVNKDFQAIPREAKNYDLGEDKYYRLLALNAIIWQFNFLGAIGVILSASSLLSGIIIAVLLLRLRYLLLYSTRRNSKQKRVFLLLFLYGVLFHIFMEK